MMASTCLVPAASGNRRISEAEPVGQGVQPQPPNWLAPQRDQFGSGGAGSRGVATAEQPAPAGARDLGGEAPAPPPPEVAALARRPPSTPQAGAGGRQSVKAWQAGQTGRPALAARGKRP